MTISAQQDLTQDVDPFIGTGGSGQTFPGATLPFGGPLSKATITEAALGT